MRKEIEKGFNEKINGIIEFRNKFNEESKDKDIYISPEKIITETDHSNIYKRSVKIGLDEPEFDTKLLFEVSNLHHEIFYTLLLSYYYKYGECPNKNSSIEVLKNTTKFIAENKGGLCIIEITMIINI